METLELDYEGIEQLPLKTFTEKAYLDYSMYVILDRALPHVKRPKRVHDGRSLAQIGKIAFRGNARAESACWRSQLPHRFLDASVQLRRQLLERSGCRLIEAKLEVSFWRSNSPVLADESASRRQLSHALECGPRRRDVLEAQKRIDRVDVGLSFEVAGCGQRGELRGEHQATTARVVE